MTLTQTRDQSAFERAQREWLAAQFDELTDTVHVYRPSEWAEAKRYLPPQVTPMPGFYRFDVTPYLREIVDCLAVDSPIREVTVLKGAQLGFTVGVLENAIGYAIDHVRTAPVMWVTADQELALQRLTSNVIPMLDHSGLLGLIKSADENNPRKSGKTDKKIEWEGGGYLLPFGAKNANKLRSFSIEILLNDEIDGWPDVVGKDGDPVKLVRSRTDAYEQSRKILNISTPLLRGQSKIEALFLQGDQRRYWVCCLQCNFPQVLRWSHTDKDGVVSGMVWETENGRLVQDSVRYLCQACGHPHTNDDKTRLLDPANGAEWRPSATASNPYHRSYHLSGLYAPVGMASWAACVEKWLEAWDVEHNRVRDVAKLQVFYNNVLGDAFELRGEKVRFEAVSSHRRSAYRYGEIPNEYARKVTASPIHLLTCAVDVHQDQLPVAVFGWTRDRRAFLIDYWRFNGDTTQIDAEEPWGKLRDLIENREYVADDGTKYRIQLTLIDSGYRADDVYRFAAEYLGGVAPIKGREWQKKDAATREFSVFTTPTGVQAYWITVDWYKDRLSAILRREWDGVNLQPPGHFNAPADATDKQLRELTAETKVPKPGTAGGYEWRRTAGVANELWDLYVYNSAALDLIAWDVCVRANASGIERIDWPLFWQLCETERNGSWMFRSK